MNDIFDKIVSIIEDVADIPAEEINHDSAFIDDLDLASLEILAIVSKLEREYSISISEEELLSVSTVDDLLNVILKKSAED